MTVKKPEQKKQDTKIKCPNCSAKIEIEDLGMVMFESCTVFSCPICSKTIAIQPKGKEFELETDSEDDDKTDDIESEEDADMDN
jgi:DNA-directed RNA polymerase subunit RPC12/RpoP